MYIKTQSDRIIELESEIKKNSNQKLFGGDSCLNLWKQISVLKLKNFLTCIIIFKKYFFNKMNGLTKIGRRVASLKTVNLS